MNTLTAIRTDKTTARTVERAADLLFAIADAHVTGSSVSELARRLDLPRSNVYRLLAALAAKGLVQPLATDRLRYQLGLRLLDLGARVRQGLNLRKVALGFMQALSKATGESVYVAVRDGWEGVVVEGVDSPRNLRLYTRIGARLPLHGGAATKVLLAWAPAEDVEALIRAGLRRYTARTITDPDRLRAHLAQIRRDGHSLSREELDEGATGIGVPVRDDTGAVVAGLSLSGPSNRFDDRALPRLIREVVRTGARISAALGSQAHAEQAPKTQAGRQKVAQRGGR
jgi:DNA-binding IclR family transcriptional regulator